MINTMVHTMENTPANMCPAFRTSVRLLTCVLLVVNLCVDTVLPSTDVYGRTEFSSDEMNPKFSHFAMDQDTGIIYIGAENALYQLNPDLSVHITASTRPSVCTGLCMNKNQILAVAPHPVDRLVTCGSHDGTCQLRSLSNITNSTSYTTRVVSEEPTVGLLGRGPDSDNIAKMYVGLSTPFPSQELKYIMGRDLTGNNLFNSPRQLTGQSNTAASSEYQVHFIDGFDHHGFAYFLTVQQQLFGENPVPEDHPYVSTINRVCETAPNFNAFTEVPLKCSVQGGNNYNLLQAVHLSFPGRDLAASLGVDENSTLLYGVFATSDENKDTANKQSAICLLKMSDVETKFVDAIYQCLTSGNEYAVNHLLSSFCQTVSPTREQAKNAQCESPGIQVFQYASARDPLTAVPLIELDGILGTSITTATEQDHTVAFIGTSDGELLKVHINDSNTRKYETVSLDDSPVQQDTYYNSSSEQLYVLTEQKLVRLSVSNCSQYTTCGDCIGANGAEDGDPYCGWCSLEARCSRYHECDGSVISTRWLPFDLDQCINISAVSIGYSVSVSVPSQQINVTVSQLPELSEGESYECRFEDYISAVTAVNGETVTCQTPPMASLPTIPTGQSSVMVDLSIYSSETGISFVKTDFNFYDCSRIKSCSSCMSSPWACDWCVYDNKCTHDSGMCSAGDTIITSDNPQALQECPRVLTPEEELLIPVGIREEFQLRAVNLPVDRSKVTGFECVLNVEGKEQTADALVPDENTVICRSTVFTYSANQPKLNVDFSLRWNSEYVIDDDNIKVMLYNCSVDRDSCSRCLSSVTTPAKLNCLWCGSICAVDGSSTCSADGINPIGQNSTMSCDPPRITGVSPPNGPLEGNTVVTVTGTDLGQVFEDIESITIGDASCSLEGMMDSYNPGRSVNCRTMSSSVGRKNVKIVVDSAEGGGGFFTYMDPQISGFIPISGIAGGGTTVTISGTNLDTGGDINAMFGNASCQFDRGDVQANTVTCKTTPSDTTMTIPLTMSFDGADRVSAQLFEFTPNPVIQSVSSTKTIYAGGLMINLTGSGFSAVQKATIEAILMKDGQELKSEEPCDIRNATMVACTSPAFSVLPDTPVQRRKRTVESEATVSFQLDGYNYTWPEPFTYYPNPVYNPFPGGQIQYTDNVVINGRNLDLASTKYDVKVWVGDTSCNIVSLDTNVLIFEPPTERPNFGDNRLSNDTKDLPLVFVFHGTEHFRIGYLEYSGSANSYMMFIIVGAIGAFILFVIIVIIICCVVNQKRYKKQLEHVQLEMQELEDAVKSEATKAFFDIQQDMSGIKDEVQGLGMPFVSSQDYIRNMLFVGLDVQPLTADPQRPEENLQRAMTDFSKLLYNKDFLLVFIRSLDEDKKLQMRDRNNIASLLTVVLVMEGKLSYLTDVMLTLMSEQITNAADNDRYRQLFRRTESIVEKILANWMALCMYSYLQDHVAYPLYYLYQAIKFQCEKGPVDVITGHAHYSLNYEFLLDEDVEFRELTLNVESQNQETETNLVKVLDVDSITQVKEKILDIIFRNKPLTSRHASQEIDLVLRSGARGQLVLRDTDQTTEKPDITRWARVNTIEHYGIPDNATVALVNRQDNPNASLATPLHEDAELLPPSPTSSPRRGPSTLLRNYTMVESDLEEGYQFYHLSHLYEDDAARKQRRGLLGKSSNSGQRVKHRKIREIYLRRLVSTKKSIQTFVDDALKAMLSESEKKPLPKALKYLFDFFDRQTDRHKLKTDTAETWKNSCLPLRFWVTAMTHPAYVFDMSQSRTVDACISVLTQMLDNACKGIVPKYNFETSPSRVLYASELPDYIEMITDFYEHIHDKPRVNQDELEEELQQVCETFQNVFSQVGTLQQLYQFASKHIDTLVEALEEDDQCQRANMGYKLEQVGTILAQGED